MVDHIDTVLAQCRRQDDVLGPTAILGTVLAQRDLVRSLLPDAPGPMRDRLLSLYAQFLRLAGWLYFDLKDYDAAAGYFEMARAAAHEARDTTLAAHILCNMSHLAVWRGQPRIGVDHAVAACQWAARSDDDHLKAYAFDYLAQAYAADQRRDATLGAIEAGRAALAGSAGSYTGLVYFYEAGQLDRTEGLCLLGLGHAERAAPLFQRSLDLLGEDLTRERGHAAVRLAQCRLALSRPDVPAAAQALDEAVRVRTARRRRTRDGGAAGRTSPRYAPSPTG